MTSADIRKQFIDFFVSKHRHAFVPSSPVVPHDDPTLLFTNAGMNQFKPIFLGQEKRAYTRAVNTQKCIRAGGKHNDLDDVGRSRRHHTFFEMLGNWSFGDYFKQGAIEMSWELLTKVWKLDPTRLHVSCFEGDEKNGVPRDTEAADIWRKVANWENFGHRSDDHIHYFGKDNFWEMGDTGPCGPCTEIYYDRTPDKTGGPYVNGEDPRVMEIWNNVFIQYNRNADRSLTVLPSQHVDTGMGFERITQVLQDVDSNYSIDLWNPFWAKLKELSGHTYSGKFPKTNSVDAAAEAANSDLRKDIAFRVIGDHIRCLTFALTDGAMPSNEGRGYVLRRILRRAVRFGRQQLELKEPFLYTLVSTVVDGMGEAFPELATNPERVAEIVKDEEVSFGRTLDRGISLFDEAAQSQIANRKSQIPAADAFKLHDTYGFPIDLTRIMAEERGMSVDIAGYEKLMEEAREKARAGGKSEASTLNTLPPNVLEHLRELNIAPTDDSEKYGYEQLRGKIVAIWDGKELVDSIKTDSQLPAALILDRTNFYAEMGGQVGDVGRIVTGGGGSFNVEATKAVGGYVLHIGKLVDSEISVGKAASATHGIERVATQQNHTSTHLANWALRETLGEGVQQKGSLVDPEKLRFDFSHGKALAEDELAKVESLVNQGIENKLPVYAKEVPQELALKINGLRAVFGEKYPPLVRVVSVGAPVDDLIADPGNAKWREFSVEFCGGTHIANSQEAAAFAIVGEESVSKGIRRLVALTGDAAKAANAVAKSLDDAIEDMETLKDDQLGPSIAAIQKAIATPNIPLRSKRRGQIAIAELQRRQKAFEKNNAAASAGATIDIAVVADDLLASAVDVGGAKIVVGHVAGATDEVLRNVISTIRKRTPSFGVLLAAAGEGKVSFVAGVSADLIAKGLSASNWVREATKITGGGGGGKPDMAQAGGKDPAKTDDALIAARAHATGLLS